MSQSSHAPMNLQPLLMGALTCALMVLLPALAVGQELPWAPATLTPPNPYGPTVVSVALYNLEVLDIDAVEETYELEADLIATWEDPRLAFDPARVGTDLLVLQGAIAEEALKTSIWWPDFELVDGRGARDRVQFELEVSSTGHVYYRERMLAKVKQSLDLSSFPFDSHTISVSVQPFSYDANSVVFEAADDDQRTVGWEPTEWWLGKADSWVTWGKNCTPSGIPCETDDECFAAQTADGAGDAGSAEAEAPSCDVGFGDLTATIDIARDPTHYIWKIIVPLVLIVLVSSGVFWLSMALYPDPGDRLTIAFTALLTCVAFDFVASGNLPKLWYTTALDRILISSYIFLALNLVENVMVVARIAKSPEGAERIDKVARWLFPLSYALTILVIVVRAA